LRLHAYSPSICWKGAATLTQSTNRISLSQSGRCGSKLCSLRATRHKSWAANRWIKLQRRFDKEQENKQKQTHVILRLRTARLRSSIHSVEGK
jgi:predicted alpha/beta superfamily hydrolase